MHVAATTDQLHSPEDVRQLNRPNLLNSGNPHRTAVLKRTIPRYQIGNSVHVDLRRWGRAAH
jgi:ribosomal protein L21E